MSKRSWQNKWTVIKSFSGGGQGATLLVHKTGDQDKIYVLKILNNQKDPERRKRMRIEVLTNEAIDHSGIPEIIDSNVDDYKNLETKLYCVFEYIEGGTLSENLTKESLSLEKALDFIIRLIEIVQYCHGLGIIHRDIKPDNIILHNSDFSKPFLIDFGLNFNANFESNDDKPTSANQHIGNRFLILPELRGTESDKRDLRSDITSIVGVLFYILTSEHPTNLTDENSSKPHQRSKPQKKLSHLSKEKLTKLNRIFDQGFNVSINDRYQTLAALTIDLIELRNNNMAPKDFKDKIVAIKNLSSMEKLNGTNRLETSTKEVSEHLRTIINSIASEFSEFSQYQTGYDLDYKKFEHRTIYGFTYKFNPAIEAKLNFRLYTNGSEEILEVLISDKISELGRRPFNGLFNWIGIKELIRELAIEEIYKNTK